MNDKSTAGYDAAPTEVEAVLHSLCGYHLAERDPLHRYHVLTRDQVLYDDVVAAIRRERSRAIDELLAAGHTATEIAEKTNLGSRQRVQRFAALARATRVADAIVPVAESGVAEQLPAEPVTAEPHIVESVPVPVADVSEPAESLVAAPVAKPVLDGMPIRDSIQVQEPMPVLDSMPALDLLPPIDLGSLVDMSRGRPVDANEEIASAAGKIAIAAHLSPVGPFPMFVEEPLGEPGSSWAPPVVPGALGITAAPHAMLPLELGVDPSANVVIGAVMAEPMVSVTASDVLAVAGVGAESLNAGSVIAESAAGESVVMDGTSADADPEHDDNDEIEAVFPTWGVPSGTQRAKHRLADRDRRDTGDDSASVKPASATFLRSSKDASGSDTPWWRRNRDTGAA